MSPHAATLESCKVSRTRRGQGHAGGLRKSPVLEISRHRHLLGEGGSDVRCRFAAHRVMTGEQAVDAEPEVLGHPDERSGMTRNQFLIWLGQQAAADRPVFNEMSVFLIPAELDVDRFHRAFAHMLEDVDALRTIVTSTRGRPHAEIVDQLRYESPLLDLSHTDDPDEALNSWALDEVDSPIDLAVRSFESTLIKLAPDRFAWALLCHQILTDATSMSIVFQRVSDWYLRLSGAAVPPSEDGPGFADFVERLAEDATSPRFRRREEYWTEKLAISPDPIQFYGGRRSSALIGTRRRRVDHRLGPQATAAVREFANDEGISSLSEHLSTYSVFCAALILYLHKLSGHRRIAIGTPWHNRPRAFAATVGLFMEQNPFAIDVDPHDTLRTLIKKVQSEAISVMRHMPYAAGNPGGRAYDVTLNYVKVLLGRFAGTPVDHHWYRPSFGDGSLQMQVHDEAGHEDLMLSFDLSVDVFDSADHQAVIDHYLICLEALISDPDDEVGSVSLVTSAEREQLVLWNGEGREAPPAATLLDLIESQAARRPDAVAVSCGAERLTYRELLESSRRVAGRLSAAGAGPGDLVGVFLNRSTDLLVALLAVLGAGAAYVPLDPAFPQDRLDHMLADSQARVLLTESGLARGVGDDRLTVVHLDDAEDGIPINAGGTRPGPDDRAYVLYTSGSTGRPKGVEVPHRALLNLLCAMAEVPGCSEDDTLLAVTTLSFDIAGLELFLPLIVGARVEIASREVAADARRLRALLESGAFTILQATPTTWRMLLDAGWSGTPRLKALVGGEALPGDIVRPVLERTSSLWNMYGPTETTIWSSVERITSEADEITVGRPIANTGFHIVDDQLKLVPIGVAGELLITGDGLALGYLGNPGLTDRRFVDLIVPGSAPIRAYRTGDLARFRPDGRVVHLGRLDHQMKVRGFRIEPGEIESNLSAHPSVRQATVSAHDTQTAHARLVAYFVPAEGGTPSAAELRAHLRAAVPDYMVPQQFVPLAEFPLTPNGKIDRERLPTPEAESGRMTDPWQPRTAIEARVAAAFAAVLGLSAVSGDDDFFELGGQSVLALRLVSILGEEFGVEVPLQTLFEASTVESLSDRISALTSLTPELQTVALGGIDVEQQLATIWLSVLGTAPLAEGRRGADLTDDQVNMLLLRVRERFGVAAEGLSAVAFREDPTVQGLASALRNALNPPQALLVPLQPKGDRPPLFLIHAGGGYVFFYRALAARLGPDQPVHAIRAATRRDSRVHRFDRTTSIEELATRYIDEIKTVQPVGPYRLGGACFGGVVAFEMAQQLVARGEEVEAPVLLFDAYLGKVPDEDWRDYASRTFATVAERLGADRDAGPAQIMRLVMARIVSRPGDVLKLGPLAARSLVRRTRALGRHRKSVQWLFDAWPSDLNRSDEQKQLDTMREFLDRSIRLVSDYDPSEYPGSAVLLQAADGLDLEPMWRPWIGDELSIHTTPGEHLDMMEEPWVERTADLVRSALGISETQAAVSASPSRWGNPIAKERSGIEKRRAEAQP
ncbi:amino acid adenylation domain-containing protein [Microbacterium sp. KUDC0406]|uniref:non-ribosomal peptide synthetase n=1 Tax=Microbacterium sp. KUDC0406 TaxID=2909588 RepID=UPI001F363B63|nr:non-ribosomal peptide synthetase [Microbacterium sp. KUDC0406]UJP09522.1 amino acid adenylation domain-containing protein [Microbacterium sp. KUDC0406]